MQLKDVEKLTGLSSKAIRLYEDKGLLVVARKRDNDYRDYTEENVQTLREIKLLRYLDFSVQDVKEFLPLSAEEKEAILAERERTIVDQEEGLQNKRPLVKSIRRLLRQGEDWTDGVEELVAFQESEVFQTLKELSLPSLWETVLLSLVYSGPLLWLFTKIGQKDFTDIGWSVGLSLIVTAFLTLTWRSYLVAWWRNRGQVSRKNRRTWLILPVFMLMLVAGIGTYVLLDMATRRFLVPSDWLFFESFSLIGKVVILLVMLWIMAVVEKKLQLWKFTPPGWALWGLPLLAVGSMAAYLEQTTVVTPDRIVNVNLFRADTVSTYAEVKQITAGFGGSRFAIRDSQRKGTFSYTIQLEKQTVTFMTPSVNDDVYPPEEAYLELENFDQELMKLGIPKISSDKNSQYNDLDDHYTQRFLRIIRNNPNNVRE